MIRTTGRNARIFDVVEGRVGGQDLRISARDGPAARSDY